jgi:chromosomal replication initiator protein
MHVVAHQVVSKNEKTHIVYTSTQSFANEFIQAIQLNSMTKFYKKYHSIHVFPLDGIPFLSGKKRIEEEFLHI